MKYFSLIFLCLAIACSYQTTTESKKNAAKNQMAVYNYQGTAKTMAHKFGIAEKERFAQIYRMIIEANKLENREKMIFKMARFLWMFNRLQ